VPQKINKKIHYNFFNFLNFSTKFLKIWLAKLKILYEKNQQKKTILALHNNDSDDKK
jgi:hypothetical protein